MEAAFRDADRTLLFNLEAHEETLSLLRPFFPVGWTAMPETVDETNATYLVNEAALALERTGEAEAALAAYGIALTTALRRARWRAAHAYLSNFADTLSRRDDLAREDRCRSLELDLAMLTGENEQIFRARDLPGFGNSRESANGKKRELCGTLWTRWGAVGPVASTAQDRLNAFTRNSDSGRET